MAGGRPRTISDEQIAKAIDKYSGVLSSVAKACKLSRQGLWKRLNASPELKAAVTEARETLVDLAESKLFKAIEKGEPWAVRLCLITIGKDRGYSRTVNVTGTVENTGVVHVLELPDNGRNKNDPA